MNKPPMPPQPTTKKIEAVVPIDTSNAALMKEIRATRVAVESVSDQVLELNERVRQIEDRADKTSSRVRGTSENDLKQDAAIATLVVKTEAIEKKTDAQTVILTDLRDGASKIAKHPAVVAFGLALISFLTALLARHTP